MKTVLVVDDDAAIREMIRMALESNDYTVLDAGDTIAARRHLHTGKPDIMLLDWMLPGQSGYEFTRTLRSKPASNSIPVIMLTARDTEEEKIAALEAGAEGFVTLEAVIRRDGMVGELRVLSCKPEGRGFEQAAIAAVRQWRYHPARFEGRPVDVVYPIFIEFVLPRE